MARFYNEREGGRDDDWLDRDEDERRLRHGGDDRGRYEASERERQPPEWARDSGYGWSTERAPGVRYNDEHRSREYWRSRENPPGRMGEPGRTVQPWHAPEPGPPGESWRSFPPRHEHPREDERGHSHENRRGGFAGKGPRGYVRSDERIREDVCDRLSADDEVDASDVTVTVAKGEVTLEGTVPDRHSKRHAEDVAEAVNGVNEVHNRLRSHKGLVQEVGDKLMGRPNESGHAGSGTRTSPSGTGVQNNH